MRNLLKSGLNLILPSYAWIPALVTVGGGQVIYFATKSYAAQAEHVDMSIFIDDQLPFVSFFVLFYVLAYGQWFWHYVYHYRKSREACYHYATVDLLARIFCLLFFLVLPAEIQRPEVTGDGIWDAMTRWIYESDTPHNLFPSIHCLASWLAFRAALERKDAPRWYAPVQLVFSLLVFASTVLIKQHFVVDIFAGIAVVEVAWLLSRRLRLWRVFSYIELPAIRESRPSLQKDTNL